MKTNVPRLSNLVRVSAVEVKVLVDWLWKYTFKKDTDEGSHFSSGVSHGDASTFSVTSHQRNTDAEKSWKLLISGVIQKKLVFMFME